VKRFVKPPMNIDGRDRRFQIDNYPMQIANRGSLPKRDFGQRLANLRESRKAAETAKVNEDAIANGALGRVGLSRRKLSRERTQRTQI
jgi:hypothetical protein